MADEPRKPGPEERKNMLTLLKDLDAEINRVRKLLELDTPGEVTWQAETMEGLILVEADGYGGGTAREVEGNYPVDYMDVRSEYFDDIDKACGKAAEWAEMFDPDMFDDDEEK